MIPTPTWARGLRSIDRLVEKAISRDVRPRLDHKIFRAPSILWTVQVHVPRARARYRCRTMVVKEK